MIKLACASLSCDGFEDRDFIHTFDLMPKAGFKFVEFNCWFPSSLTLTKMRDLKRRCEASGLIPAAIHGNSFGGTDRSEITKDVSHKLWMLEAARELGCRRIVASGVKRGNGGGMDTLITVLKELAPAAEEYDMFVCLENHKNNNIEFIEDYERIFDAIDSPHIGACIDTGHFDASDVNLDDLIDRLKNRINHIHLKENKLRGTVSFTRFGEGTTDNANVINRMIGYGYNGFLTIELSPKPDRPITLDDLITSRRMFECFEK